MLIDLNRVDQTNILSLFYAENIILNIIGF